MNDPAETLVDRAKSGDYSAASELIRQTYAGIFNYFKRLCGSDEDAADLTQRTFVKVWQSLAGFSRRSSVKTWIHSIAHNVYVDWRRQPVRSQLETQKWWDSCISQNPTPLETTIEKEGARRVCAALERLDHEQRETVHLHYFQNLSINETAQVLGVATSTVKYRLRNALEQLQSRLSEPKIHAGERHE
jgi:RNA polymerase sigma factor (sigma-70 family)